VNRLLALERTIAIGVPEAADQDMNKQYVVFHVLKGYHEEYVIIQDPWGRNEEIHGPHWQITGYMDTRL
jgi:hypothetical protein